MSDVILSDEEVEALHRAKMGSHILTATEKADLQMDADRELAERENNRRDQQAYYDQHRGADLS